MSKMLFHVTKCFYRIITFLCILVLHNLDLSSQNSEYDLAHTITVQNFITIKKKTERNGFVSICVPGPYSRRQDFKRIEYNYPPAEIDSSSINWIFKWTLEDLREKDTIALIIDYSVYRYDYRRAAQISAIDNFESDLSYPVSQEEKDFNKKLKKIATKLSGNTKDETLRNVYEYVLTHEVPLAKKSKSLLGERVRTRVDRINNEEEMLQAVQVLLSANDIPSRFRSGYSTNTGIEAGLIEVFLQDKGWIPFNPYYAKYWKIRDKWDIINEGYLYLDKADCLDYSDDLKVSLDRLIVHPIRNLLDSRHAQKLPYTLSSFEKIENALNRAPTYYSAMLLKAMYYAEHGQYEMAEPLLQYALKNALGMQKGAVFYSYSRYYCLKGNKERALQFLSKVPEYRLNALAPMHYHPEFDLIRDDLRYKKIHKKMRRGFMQVYNY